jgi:hypothetical protein
MSDESNRAERLVLRRHTPIEVALGAIIGAATGAAIHYV